MWQLNPFSIVFTHVTHRAVWILWDGSTTCGRATFLVCATQSDDLSHKFGDPSPLTSGIGEREGKLSSHKVYSAENIEGQSS